MNKLIKYIIGITVALVLPLSLYLVARQYSDGHIKIPKYYQPEGLDTIVKDGKTTVDSFYHRVKDLKGYNQLGEMVSLNNNLKGKILVVDFIFTTCKSVCPRLSSAMQMLQKSYIKKNPEWVQFVSISVDPVRDSVPVLREYADRYTKEHDQWWFIYANKDSVFDYAKNELAIKLNDGDVLSQPDHSQMIVLLDTARHIRGYYDGLNNEELRQLADDIAILTLEKNPKK